MAISATFQLRQVLVVVKGGGRCHPIGTVTEEDLVEIELQDLLFRQGLLHMQCQQHLQQLAPEGLLR